MRPHLPRTTPRQPFKDDNTRRAQLLEQPLQQGLVTRQRPQSTRQLWQEDASTVPFQATSIAPASLGVRMPPIHRRPSPSPSPATAPSDSPAGGSGSLSGVQMHPPHLLLPDVIHALLSTDERGVPILGLISYVYVRTYPGFPPEIRDRPCGTYLKENSTKILGRISLENR
ncbi:hypothetical protein ACLB2K_047158 [Fragaria x ananassa]